MANALLVNQSSTSVVCRLPSSQLVEIRQVFIASYFIISALNCQPYYVFTSWRTDFPSAWKFFYFSNALISSFQFLNNYNYDEKLIISTYNRYSKQQLKIEGVGNEFLYSSRASHSWLLSSSEQPTKQHVVFGSSISISQEQDPTGLVWCLVLTAIYIYIYIFQLWLSNYIMCFSWLEILWMQLMIITSSYL